ncbi:MAG TPA: hypothetical protein VNJ08_15960 [Bacteriovoracaceae bacterium]|nr:hypothetical protein [Bacteriovoracaceae bacterium]
MKRITLLFLLISLPVFGSVIGITTHPLSDEARVLSAELTGFLSERHEMGMGARYTQTVGRHNLMDFAIGGAQHSRSLTLGTGIDFAILDEDVSQPRVSVKPFLQYLKFDNFRQNVIGAAPTIRKGLNIHGYDFYPYLAIPAGLKVDSITDEFVYYASLTIGASMPFPGADPDKLLLSLEGNKDMGASSDYVSLLVSWIWR